MDEHPEAGDQWWVAKDGKHQGPFPEDQIRSEVRSGKINPQTLVCPVGGHEWKAVGLLDNFKTEVRAQNSQDPDRDPQRRQRRGETILGPVLD